LPKYEANAIKLQLPMVREALRTGKTPRGKPLTFAQRASFVEVLAESDSVLPDLEQARHVAPSLTFAKELRIHLGKREVRILFLGRGNTAGDAVVYVPETKTLVTGDLVVHPVPYAFGSFIGEWAKTMTALLGLDAVAIVPGHGPLLRDRAYLRRVEQLLATLASQARAAVARHETLEAARAKLDIAAVRAELTGGDAELDRELDAFVLDPGFPRAFREAAEGPLHDEN
jgi:cyclase